MNPSAKFLLAIPAFLLATIFEMVAHRFAIFGARPQFLLTTGLVFSLFSSPAGAACSGLAAGLLQGFIAGANLTAYTVSRVVAACMASFVPRVGVVVRAGAGFAAVVVGSIIANILLIFLAPRPDLSAALSSTITSAIYNGVIALPFCALLGASDRRSSR